ncbi:MAG: hypothetical protein K8L91_03195 [Anaerolineae bacterium]|nr:hypothetical protein [Anaerolineae bacterium]
MDVLSNTIQIGLIADDMVMIAPLPSDEPRLLGRLSDLACDGGFICANNCA